MAEERSVEEDTTVTIRRLEAKLDSLLAAQNGSAAERKPETP